MDWQPWLPDGAIGDGNVQSKFEKTFSVWAEKWFASPPQLTVSVRVCDGCLATKDLSLWRSKCQTLSASLATYADAILAGKILGIDVHDKTATPTDKQFLNHLATQCFKDGLTILSSQLGVSTEWDRGNRLQPVCLQGMWDIHLGIDEGEELFRISVPISVLASERKRNLINHNRLSEHALIDDAISKNQIRVGAFVGAAKLKLADMESLACGDVIVIDKGNTDNLNLTIDDTRIPELNCQVLLDDHKLSLKLNGK